jgi:SNF2 family DNA or RNA helicase
VCGCVSRDSVQFLKGRVRTVALSESSRADVIASMNTFLRPNSIFQVMIVSYETFRIHADKFAKEGSCDLLICDEAHRLKNADTLTNKVCDPKLPSLPAPPPSLSRVLVALSCEPFLSSP